MVDLRLAVALGLTCLCACSMIERRNRPTLNFLDAELTPPTTAGKIAAGPIALPAGLLALAVDFAAVRPVTVADDAWHDTVALLWTGEQETTLRRALWLPVAAVATPVVCVGDWLGRWLFPIAPVESGS